MRMLTAEEFLGHYRLVMQDCTTLESGSWAQPLTARLEALREEARAAYAGNDADGVAKAAKELGEIAREVAQRIAQEGAERPPLQTDEDGFTAGADAP